MKNLISVFVVLCVALFVAGCEQQAEMYQKANMKTRWMEAQTTLQSIALTQMTFKAGNMRFAGSFKEMSFSLTGDNNTYSYFMGGDFIKGVSGPDTLPEGLDNPSPTDNAFVVYAVANLDSDEDWDIWKTDQNRSVQHVRSDLAVFTP